MQNFTVHIFVNERNFFSAQERGLGTGGQLSDLPASLGTKVETQFYKMHPDPTLFELFEFVPYLE